MKKILITMLALSLVFGLTACDGGDSYDSYEFDDYQVDDYENGYENEWESLVNSSIAKGEYYHLIGGSANIFFHEGEGWGDTLQFNHFEEYGGIGSIYGGLEYTISGDRLTVTDDGAFFAAFTIVDMHTLVDDDGNTYAVESSGFGEVGLIYSGVFVGDKGTVYVSESYFSDMVDLKFSLHADLYIMASLTITDSYSAASNDITMYIDGDTLTVEAINPGYEDCAGVYERYDE